MPYVNNDIKEELINDLNNLIENIKSISDIDDREGIVNYVISTIVSECLKPSEGWRYKNMNRAVGTFESAKLEFYRRIVGPYEDKAIEKNGDILAYAKEEL